MKWSECLQNKTIETCMINTCVKHIRNHTCIFWPNGKPITLDTINLTSHYPCRILKWNAKGHKFYWKLYETRGHDHKEIKLRKYGKDNDTHKHIYIYRHCLKTYPSDYFVFWLLVTRCTHLGGIHTYNYPWLFRADSNRDLNILCYSQRFLNFV